MGPLGWQETVFIFFLALLLFGPKKLPELGRTIGKAMTEFRRASSELKTTFDREMRTLEQEADIKELKQAVNDVQYDTYNYDYSSYEGGNYESSNYEGSYGAESYDSAVSDPSTLSASAPEGAESPSAAGANGDVAAVETNGYAPEDTVARGGLGSDAPSNGHADPASEPADRKA
jgi:TatA/E family protein of Tat protein translocase